MKRFLKSSIGSAVATYVWRNRRSLMQRAKEVFGRGKGAVTSPQRSHVT